MTGTDLGMLSSRVIRNAKIDVIVLVKKAHLKMDIWSVTEMFNKIVLQILDVDSIDMPTIKAIPQKIAVCSIHTGSNKLVSRSAKASHGATVAQHSSGKPTLYRRFARDVGIKIAMIIPPVRDN
jgi:hypothetical protein